MITQKLLKELLHYDQQTGVFTWKLRGELHFSEHRERRRWNTRYAGKRAGVVHSDGYRYIKLDRKRHQEHRIVWMLIHGKFPPNEIDHINGRRDDNRLCNIRCVTRAENSKNRKLNSANTSGCMGVHWKKELGKWVSRITNNGIRIHLGCFDDKAEAITARKTAEKRLGFHENHGRRL